ncbi:hypothetical protein scyTo_0014539 [Scyliorhinus torazame]|uniref:Uncharacterized protein n=1 Tax=Scyliorhinus torazame TaxID=75743 RepID=A0A401NPK0_SCYTO|nr:hypothetical protein [Scyliorhinus torazame]
MCENVKLCLDEECDPACIPAFRSNLWFKNLNNLVVPFISGNTVCVQERLLHLSLLPLLMMVGLVIWRAGWSFPGSQGLGVCTSRWVLS